MRMTENMALGRVLELFDREGQPFQTGWVEGKFVIVCNSTAASVLHQLLMEAADSVIETLEGSRK